MGRPRRNPDEEKSCHFPKLRNSQYETGEFSFRFWGFLIDKTHSETAERELREETGFTAGKMTHLATLRTAVAWCDETTELFLAEDLKKDGDQILDPAEEIAVGAFDLDELYAMILDGRIDDAKTVAGLFGYLAVRGRASSH